MVLHFWLWLLSRAQLSFAASELGLERIALVDPPLLFLVYLLAPVLFSTDHVSMHRGMGLL